MAFGTEWDPSMDMSKFEESLIVVHGPHEKKNTNKQITQEELVRTLFYPNHQDLLFPEITPPNCPKGLELLSKSRTLIIHRRPENAINLFPEHRLLAFAQYDIVNSEGRQLYVGVEKTTYKSVFWTRDARIFNVTLYDNKCKQILTIQRPWTCCFCFAQYYCFFCMFGFQGCGNQAVVTLCEGKKRLGHIVQKFSCHQMLLNIYDEDNEHVMCIHGKLLDGIFDIVLPEEEDEPIAMIESSMTPRDVSDFYKIKVSSYEDPYGITFFTPDISQKNKALIISAVILMDYIFCKPSGDYPHWTQSIPADFKPKADTYNKVFRDGSKEIIVTSMKPKTTRGKINEQSGCGCCRWFCGFICLCCPLGMVRNAFRCTQLICFTTLIILLIVFLIIFDLYFL